MRTAKPVNGSVHSYQSDGVQVADDPVVLDGLVRHESTPCQTVLGQLDDHLHSAIGSLRPSRRGAPDNPSSPAGETVLLRRKAGPPGEATPTSDACGRGVRAIRPDPTHKLRCGSAATDA